MNIVLKPDNTLEMDDIHIEGHLFSVGRKEEPFASCCHESVSKLSRKHARIFEENGEIYVVDLGSLNGTKVNQQPLSDQPQPLKHGDQVEFSGLSFEVVIEGDTQNRKMRQVDDGDESTGFNEDKERAKSINIGLMLTPEGETNGQPIQITEFPFLVSKSEGVFYDNRARFDSVYQYISRRHAYIFIKDGGLYLEDLNSTNGTFRNDLKLEDEPLALASNDVVAFGNRHLRFRVKVIKEGGQDTAHSGDEAITTGDHDQPETSQSQVEVEPGTILVNRASPFLDIFCAESGADQPQEGQTQPPENQKGDSQHQGVEKENGKTPPSTVIGRVMVFITELKMALSGSTELDHNRPKKEGKGIVFAVLGLVIIVLLIALLFTRESTERELKTLIAERQYSQAARLANQYLSDNPNDTFVKSMAFDALLKAVIPEWQTLIQQGQFDEAADYLTQAIKNNIHNTRGVEALELLQLVSDFEQFTQSRKNAPLTHIYLTEVHIEGLIREWEADSDGHRQIMDRISVAVNEFNDTHSTFYSQLRSLKTEKGQYASAINTLTKQISLSLELGDDQQLQAVISDFIDKYSNIGGLNALKEDLQNYLLIKAAVDEGNPIALKQVAEHLTFHTPPFKQRVQSLLVNIPTDEFIAKIQHADELWSRGEFDRAIDELQTLQTSSETKLVSTLLDRYRRVNEHWKKLGGLEEKPYSRDQLIALYALLDREKDAYIWTALKDDFQTLEGDIKDQAKTYVNEAKKAWDKYLTRGGIWGALRLETTISETYREQAELLSDAYRSINEGSKLYDALGIQKPTSLSVLEEKIKGEATRQRKWINDLHLVLDLNIREAKVNQLPSEEQR